MRPVRSNRRSSGGTNRALAAEGSQSPIQLPPSDDEDATFPSPSAAKKGRRSAAAAAAAMTVSRSGRRINRPTHRDDEEDDGDNKDNADVGGRSNVAEEDDDDNEDIPRSRSRRRIVPGAKPRKSSERKEVANGKPARQQQGRTTPSSSSRSTPTRKVSSTATKTKKEGKEEVDEAARVKEEEEERKVMQRWAEEYYEIVEQLPLELHRSYTLMRELETKLQARISFVASNTKAYRDARIAFDDLTPEQKALHVKASEAATAAARLRDAAPASVESQHDVQDLLQGSSTDADAEGEDAAEVYMELAGEAYSPERQAATDKEHETETTSDEAVRDATPAVSVAAADESSAAIASLDLAPTRAARLALLSSIAQASSEALRIADEKVGLAVSAYELVDQQIRRLDGDLQKSENGLLLGLRAGTEASRGLQDALGVNLDGSGDKGGGSGDAGRWDEVETLLLGHPANDKSAVAQRKGRARGRKSTKDHGVSKATASTSKQEHDNLTADMAIDPNEPTYCYCDQVSYGDMIACDNEDCPREWFHYHCVGFTQPPKGRWFCLFCAPAMGFKGAGTFPPDAPCLPPGMAAGAVSGGGGGGGWPRRGRGGGYGGGGGGRKRKQT